MKPILEPLYVESLVFIKIVPSVDKQHDIYRSKYEPMPFIVTISRLQSLASLCELSVRKNEESIRLHGSLTATSFEASSLS